MWSLSLSIVGVGVAESGLGLQFTIFCGRNVGIVRIGSLKSGELLGVYGGRERLRIQRVNLRPLLAKEPTRLRDRRSWSVTQIGRDPEFDKSRELRQAADSRRIRSGIQEAHLSAGRGMMISSWVS